MKKILILCIVLICTFSCKNKHRKHNHYEKNDKPKLVVGIVVDQMRYDYLIRFREKFGKDGFLRLMNKGFNYENAHYNYIPTYTAVGHTSIYTGTTPENHGIIGNNWYDKDLKQSIYCVDDKNYQTVGAEKGGEKSPFRLQTTTITDQLKLAQNNQGKMIGVSIKDRSAILPTGFTSDGSYWFQGRKTGKFITSTYYKENLPDWVTEFNQSNMVDSLSQMPWNTLLPIESYTESLEDDNDYEGTFKGEDKPTFPHKIKSLKKKNKDYDILKAIPHGNTLVRHFAQQAILGEQMGKGAYTDFLAMSFSSTDYIGHKYGVDSKEVEDAYLRLDRDIAAFLQFLDKNIGENEYTVFLSSDHGAVPVPSYLQDKKIPAGYIKGNDLSNKIAQIADSLFGSRKIVEDVSNFQVFLNREALLEKKLDRNTVAQKLSDAMLSLGDEVYKSTTAQTLQNTSFSENTLLGKLQKGYNQKYSGDILFVPKPARIVYSKTGSTHGSGYTYDTHIPIILYGKHVFSGKSKRKVAITDIAPTISNLLEITAPNGNTGEILNEAITKRRKRK